MGVGEKEIAVSSHLTQDLNASSLEIADLIAKLEEAFAVKVPKDEASQFLTVGDIITFFLNHTDET